MMSDKFQRPNECSSNVMDNINVPLAWTHIDMLFSQRYHSVFMARDIKAHFDCCSEVVDGARERWKDILLLDALVSTVLNVRTKDSSDFSSASPDLLSKKLLRRPRRQFDQFLILRECIIDSLKMSLERLTFDSNRELVLQVLEVEHPWNTTENIRDFLNTKIKKSKSVAKYLKIVNLFLDENGLLSNLSTADIIREVIFQVCDRSIKVCCCISQCNYIGKISINNTVLDLPDLNCLFADTQKKKKQAHHVDPELSLSLSHFGIGEEVMQDLDSSIYRYSGDTSLQATFIGRASLLNEINKNIVTIIQDLVTYGYKARELVQSLKNILLFKFRCNVPVQFVVPAVGFCQYSVGSLVIVGKDGLSHPTLTDINSMTTGDRAIGVLAAMTMQDSYYVFTVSEVGCLRLNISDVNMTSSSELRGLGVIVFDDLGRTRIVSIEHLEVEKQTVLGVAFDWTELAIGEVNSSSSMNSTNETEQFSNSVKNPSLSFVFFNNCQHSKLIGDLYWILAHCKELNDILNRLRTNITSI